MERLIHLRRTPATNLEKSIGQPGLIRASTLSLEAFLERLFYDFSKGFAGLVCEAPGQFIRLPILDADRHDSTFLPGPGVFPEER